jgi:tetratricopeptide (TPR) repeat protein
LVIRFFIAKKLISDYNPVIMKLKQLIFTAIFIVSCISIGFTQTDREKGVELFNKGDYQGAVDVLNQAVKSNENDVIALYNLGLAYEKINKTVDAIKSFEQAVTSCSDIISNKIEQKIIGIVSEEDPFMKNSFTKYMKEFESGYLSVKRFSEINSKEAKSDAWQRKFTLIESFAPNSDIAKTFVDEEPTTQIKLNKNPIPEYTPLAQKNRFRGAISLRVLFLANGKIGVVLPVNQLPFGLTKTSIEAAYKIKFNPAKVGEKPVSVWAIVNYGFKSSNKLY